MSAMALWTSQRGRIAVALSLCFVWATYFLWTGERESLITMPHSWTALKNPIPITNKTNPNIVDIDHFGSLNDHFALHTQTFAPASPSKGSNINHDDYDNHFAVHTKTFSPLRASVIVQATPIPAADGKPMATLTVEDFDDKPIQDLCAQTTWGPSRDVVINCEGRVGGVGNVKQEILVCVRHAIEIGASLIRPTIMLRDEGLIEYQHGPIRDISYMFDLETFDARLRKACPLLPLYPDMRTLERHGRPIARVGRPRDLPVEDGQPMTPKAWAEKNMAGEGKITVIDYPLIMGQAPVCIDDASFVTNFGRLLELRSDAKGLAARALNEMAIRFGFSPAVPHGVTENAFVGVHLRTEVDAINVGYASYEKQAEAYLDYINSTSLRVVYAASGNTTSLELFARAAFDLSPPAQVVTKWDLLLEDDRALLKSMTWDQQALVDYLILERSSKFAGVSESSFSWGIAYKRQKFGDVKPCTLDSTEEMTDDDGIVYEDSLSKLCGRQDDFFVDKMWP